MANYALVVTRVNGEVKVSIKPEIFSLKSALLESQRAVSFHNRIELAIQPHSEEVK
jgi:hypothetical protein